MSLTDDIAAAEQRARDLVTCPTTMDAEDLDAALDRLMAVCKLAGRWEALQATGCRTTELSHSAIRADLARLMEGCGE